MLAIQGMLSARTSTIPGRGRRQLARRQQAPRPGISVTSWLIARTGLAPESIQLPDGGRAPGWKAGLVVARRQEAQRHPA